LSKADRVRDRVAVVTGATAGVGRAIAQRFAHGGARVGLIARDEAALAEFARELKADGVRVAYAAIDIADPSAVFAAAEKFERELGPIAIWVNDAMCTVFSPIDKIAPEEFRRVTEVTYLGQVYGCMAAIRHMRPRNEGHIINIGSALAYRGIPLQAAYCGAKYAVRGFTSALRTELVHGRSGVFVSLMELPAMNTPQFDWARTRVAKQPKPLGTIYQPEAVAETVFRAAIKRPREYWIGLSTILTVIGNMVAPDFMDYYLAKKAVKGQQTDEPVAPDRRDNLLAPVTPLHRTRGHFGQEAKGKVWYVSGQAARAALFTTGALLFFALGGALFRRSRPHS
jgi:short-subunit dehydrogenase